MNLADQPPSHRCNAIHAANSSRDSTLRILHAASKYEIRQRKQKQGTRENVAANGLFRALIVFPFGAAVLLAATVYFLNASWLLETSVAALLIGYVGLFVQPIISLWIHRKPVRMLLAHPFGILVRNAAATATVDLRYLPKLERKPLKLLEVIALEVRAEREFFERRISLVVGAIEKVGIAPGLLAAVLSLYKLPSDLADWALGIAYATPMLYFMGMIAHFMVMRLDRMTKLLELAIARKRAAAGSSIQQKLREVGARNR